MISIKLGKLNQCRLCLKYHETLYNCQKCPKSFCSTCIDKHKICINNEYILYDSYVIDTYNNNPEIIEHIERSFDMENINLEHLVTWCGKGNNKSAIKSLDILKYIIDNGNEYTNNVHKIRLTLNCPTICNKYQLCPYSSYIDEFKNIIIRCSSTEPRLFTFSSGNGWVRLPEKIMLDLYETKDNLTDILNSIIKLLAKI